MFPGPRAIYSCCRNRPRHHLSLPRRNLKTNPINLFYNAVVFAGACAAYSRFEFPGLYLVSSISALPCPTRPGSAGSYCTVQLRIPVDEISLTFHASDPNGKPLTQLTARDLDLSDNGKRQSSVLMLQSLQDLPIRAGFLFDISASLSKRVGASSIIRELTKCGRTSRPLRQSSGISTVSCTSRPALQPMDLFIASGCNPWFPVYAS
jgi:hypothetical protein